MIRKNLLSLALTVVPATAALAVYCGVVSVPGGGGTGAGGNPAACHFYVAASGGSDSNTGTSSATPFATLEKAQTAMQGIIPGTSKVTCLKAGSGGTYNRGATLTLGTNDNNETWQFDPASGVNTAILDGGSTVDLVNICGASNVTINGIKMQHVKGHAIYNQGCTSNSFTLENSDIGFNVGSSVCADGFPPIICMGSGTNQQILNNYVHDAVSQGIALFAFNAGDSINGSVISGNVVLRAVTTIADGGAIYVNMRNTGVNGGTVTVKNNFVRDYGSASLTNDMECIYFDDFTSNSTAQGNICGPPITGAPSDGGANNSACWLVHSGTNNIFTNNICDTGLSGQVENANFFQATAQNQFINNLVVDDFPGNLNTTSSGVTGFAYYDSAGATIQNNAYINFGGGQSLSNGTNGGDTNPVQVTAANLQCSGYLYALGKTSSIFSPPVSFQAIVGGWGPPGFIIPTSTNHSCP